MTASYYHYNTPFGAVTIGSDGSSITRLAFGVVDLPGQMRPTVLTNQASNQLQEYLAGKRKVFSLPLKLEGSEFQRKVWEAIDLIPYGSTKSYGEVARSIGKPNSARAVGQAARANPLPIFIPCHRVVPANGSFGEYVGGPKTKAFLLSLEASC